MQFQGHMASIELQPFIDAAKEQGAGDEFLASLLTRRGWPAGDVYNALGNWWERSTGVPVPGRSSAGENARDAFLYLLAFSTLAMWGGSLGSLLFALIDHWLPDAVTAQRYYDFRSTVTWQMAAILVALPVYLFVMRLILRETRLNPDRVESGVRKWLTYIALLLTASAVISDMVVFVDYFLKGEITVRFVLKCATVLAICGSIFWYYLGFLRGQARSWRYTALAVAGAGAAFCAGLLTAGSPPLQRQFAADNRRIQDLRSVAAVLASTPALPASLATLKESRPSLAVNDPVTRAPYEYTLKAGRQYELCATFSKASDSVARQHGGEFWSHPQGRACFQVEAMKPVPW
jgi:hypothetical protein